MKYNVWIRDVWMGEVTAASYVEAAIAASKKWGFGCSVRCTQTEVIEPAHGMRW